MEKRLERILPRVQKPARYVGGEYNQVVKDKAQVDVRFAFCFPDTYEIGMSNLGMRILYGVMNNNGYIVNAGDSLAIKGFRKDKHTEAAFQFANVADSYAANSAQGDVRNTGVIGFAAFELQGPAQNALPPCSGQAFPADNNGYAPPPCRK